MINVRCCLSRSHTHRTKDVGRSNQIHLYPTRTRSHEYILEEDCSSGLSLMVIWSYLVQLLITTYNVSHFNAHTMESTRCNELSSRRDNFPSLTFGGNGQDNYAMKTCNGSHKLPTFLQLYSLNLCTSELCMCHAAVAPTNCSCHFAKNDAGKSCRVFALQL